MVLAACGGGNGSDSTAAADPAVGGSTGGGAAASGGGGSSTTANSKPTISGTPSPQAVTNQAYAFQPSAQDADGDVLTFNIQNRPSWASFDLATGKLQGTPAPSDVGTYDKIQISVSDGADDAALAAFTITVADVAAGAVQLSWQAPTENEDGTPLTDLAGYKLYWGTTAGAYTSSVTIDNPGVLNYVVENLAPNTYYFVATAFNTAGAESAPSQMASANL